MNSPQFTPVDRPQARFATTRWSLVAAAVRNPRMLDDDSRRALSELCATYWQPLYAYARHSGYQSADAADLTQSFFAKLLDHGGLQSADRERGRFRSFLLAAFRHFLLNEYDRERTIRRGGRETIVAIDAVAAESGYLSEPGTNVTAEDVFERKWAVALLQRVLDLLQSEYAARGKTLLFELCRDALTGVDPTRGYAAIATECGMTESAVKVAVHRLRARYRELLIQEVRETVDSADEIADELRTLFRSVAD